jgi:hypothetical protein
MTNGRPSRTAGQKRLIQPHGCVELDTDIDVDPVRTQRRKAATVDLRKRIAHRRDNASNARGDDAFSTRSCLSSV